MNKFYRGWEIVPEGNGYYNAIKRGEKLLPCGMREEIVRRIIDRYEYIDFQLDEKYDRKA